MDREVTVNLTPQLLRLTIFYQARAILWFLLLAFLWVVANLGIFLSYGGVLTGAAYFSVLTVAIILAFIALKFYGSYAKGLSQIQKMKNPEMKYRFTDDWLYVDSELGSSKNSWPTVKGLRKNPKLWRLISQSNTSFSIPVEQLDGELKAFLTAKFLKGKGAQLG
jgi:hypothetical protein